MVSARQYKAKTEQLRAFLTTTVEDVNRWVGFSQRKRQCDAETFVQTLVLGWLATPTASLNQLATTAHALNHTITRQGLHARFTARAVALLVGVLQASFQRQGGTIPSTIPGLRRLNGVFVTDSTQIALPQCLASDFPGNTGNSMGKLHVSWDYLSGRLHFAPLEAGKTPDQRNPLPILQAQVGSLQLFDLGYFSQATLAQIHAQDAFFLTRYQAQTALYAAQTGERVELLDRLPMDKLEWTGEVTLGAKARLPVRLVARRVPAQVAAHRRRQVKAKAKKQGKQCSARYLHLQDWDILITNLDPEAFPLPHLFNLYAIRWQIELIFRTWKSQLALARLGDWKPERVLCQLYAHLIACVLCHDWTHAWRWREGYEYSLPKLIQLIQQHLPDLLRLLKACGQGGLAFWRSLERDFRQFARKDKRRKSPSTYQTLMNWGLS